MPIAFYRRKPVAAVVFCAAAVAGVLDTSAQSEATSASAASRVPMNGVGLGVLLHRLQENLDAFNRGIKSFECSEHIVSSRTPAPDGSFSARQATDSVFRVRRSDDRDDKDNPESDTDNPTRNNLLHEARLVKLVDGRPEQAETTRLNSPYVFFGIFIGGLSPVTTSAAACFHYKLHPAKQDRIVIDFVSWPHHDAAHSCPYPDNTSGRAWVDVTSMQVVHMDVVTKEYEVEHGVKGTWTWSVLFEPVTLGGNTFWLPATIRSDEEADHGHGVPLNGGSGQSYRDHVSYALTATYRNYRLLKSSATILPAP